MGSGTNIFKVRRYLPDFPGFQGLVLTPGDPIEIYVVDDLTAAIDPTNTDVTLMWNPHHSSFYPYNYYVYSSAGPFSGFGMVHTTVDTSWTFPETSAEMYYRITMEIFP